MKIRFELNGHLVVANIDIRQTLLEYLRSCGYYSVKYGCDHGECGACTVLVDGKAQNACLILMHSMHGKSIETVEGLAAHDKMHPLQKQFLEEGAIQCGYCTPGMILSAQALLREIPSPDAGDIREALAGNLCRCTGYVKPVKAIRK